MPSSEKEWDIIDEQECWEFVDSDNSPLSDPEITKNMSPEEEIVFLRNEAAKMRTRIAGDFNKKGLDSYEQVKASVKVTSGMKQEQVDQCTKILAESLRSVKKNQDVLAKKDLSDLVTVVKSKLDVLYGNHRWHVMTGRKMSFHLTSSAYINFWFKDEDMTIVMFKAYGTAA